MSEPGADSGPTGLRRPEAEALLQAGQARVMPAQSLLCEEGKITDRFFFVAAGTVEISKSIAGTRRTLATSGTGSVLALMAALDGAPSAVSMRTQSDATVVEITRSRLLAMLDSEEPTDANLVHALTLVAICRLRSATDELAQALHHALRSSLRAGRMDPCSLARIQAGNHAWPCAWLAA